MSSFFLVLVFLAFTFLQSVVVYLTIKLCIFIEYYIRKAD